jgi:chromatin remodeling complex protein RSC6
MVRASSKTSSNSVVAPSKVESKPVVEAAMASAAAPEKKSRKSAAAKTLGTTESVVAAAAATAAAANPLVAAADSAVPANEVVVDQQVDASSIPTPSLLSAKFAEFGAKLQQTVSLLTTLKTEYKSLSKVLEKNQRLALKKINDKRKKASGNRRPSGFVKPTRITNELATFLGKSHGTLIARTEVSREINKYIRAHSLQDKSNGRKIIPDEKLSALLNISANDELTYFNLQKFMKHHFIKEVAVATA